jgi:hypothetical protein
MKAFYCVTMFCFFLFGCLLIFEDIRHYALIPALKWVGAPLVDDSWEDNCLGVIFVILSTILSVRFARCGLQGIIRIYGKGRSDVAIASRAQVADGYSAARR